MIYYQFLIDAQLRPDKTPDFSAYPFCLPAVRHLGRLEFDPAVTFIVGENGSSRPRANRRAARRASALAKAP